MGIFNKKSRTKLVECSPDDYAIDIQQFLDVGVLEEVVKTDEFALCKTYGYYVLFPYYKTIDGQLGIQFGHNILTGLVENDNFYPKFIASPKGQAYVQKSGYAYSRDILLQLLDIKKRHAGEVGPEIRLDLEEQLIAKYKSKQL